MGTGPKASQTTWSARQVVAPLRVLVDASQLTGQSAHSGIGSYVRNLLGGLGDEPDLDVHALATDDANLPGSVHRQRIVRRHRTGRPAIYEHEVRRLAEARWARPDVFHNPNPHAPLRPPRPWVQTLFDVIPLAYDDPVAAGLKRRYQRFGPRYRHADAVIAISRQAADEGMRLLDIPAARIEVIHLGVGPEFTPGSAPDAADPYLLMVCEYSRRKGLAETLAVLDQVAEAGYPHRLRIAGRVNPWVANEHAELVRSCAHPERVDVLGFVDDLPSLYRGAALLIVTSRHEGFGLPALEAMACGTPVVAFANTSLPEVIGTGGVLVADGDVRACADAVRRILGSAAHRSELSASAVDRARQFPWDRAARAHAGIYRLVAR